MCLARRLCRRQRVDRRALQRNEPRLDTEQLVGTLENLRDLDVGLGTPVSFTGSEH